MTSKSLKLVWVLNHQGGELLPNQGEDLKLLWLITDLQSIMGHLSSGSWYQLILWASLRLPSGAQASPYGFVVSMGIWSRHLVCVCLSYNSWGELRTLPHTLHYSSTISCISHFPTLNSHSPAQGVLQEGSTCGHEAVSPTPSSDTPQSTSAASASALTSSSFQYDSHFLECRYWCLSYVLQLCLCLCSNLFLYHTSLSITISLCDWTGTFHQGHQYCLPFKQTPSNSAFLVGGTIPVEEFTSLSSISTLLLHWDLWHCHLCHHHLACIKKLHSGWWWVKVWFKSEPWSSMWSLQGYSRASIPLQLVSTVMCMALSRCPHIRGIATATGHLYSLMTLLQGSLPPEVKSETFAFKPFKAWAENVTGGKTGHSEGYKGREALATFIHTNTILICSSLQHHSVEGDS